MRKANTKCDWCNTPFYKRPKQLQETKNNFCNKDCFSSWKLNKSKKTCPTCKTSFNGIKSNQIFCSQDCFKRRVRDTKSHRRKSHRNKSVGILQEFKELGWDGKCMVSSCNYEKTHDVHRFIEGKNGGKYSIENTFALCPNHHAEYHRGLTKFEIINNLLIKEI